MRKLARQQPLRFKLMALVLILLTFAIVLIGVASSMAMRTYLIDKLDKDLARAAGVIRSATASRNGAIISPDLVFAEYAPMSKSWSYPDDVPFGEALLPSLPLGTDLREGEQLTVNSKGGKPKWRVLMFKLPDNVGGDRTVIVAKSYDDLDGALNRLFWINVYAGASVLMLAASIGTELIRRSFRPLVAIEKTAGAIASGDLTKRVPDPEAGEPETRTEVGSLARSLNTMLAQIEAAFTAQAASETAARAAEFAARDAAESAQVSEARAVRSEERMRQFVADASHELRTPLTTIRGFAELYRQGAVQSTEDTASLVRRIEDEARRMGLLVEDLLLLARMDQERPLRPVPVELRVLAVDAVQNARMLAPDRQIALTVAPGSGELVVSGDDARLRQVISNLMGNALAHTPKGTPVELRLGRQEAEAFLEVIDQGPGLSPEHRERVFERFYRSDAARTRRVDGHVSTGLGLAIVAALVAAHNGTVEVESEHGHGATFRVRLPLLEQDDASQEISSADSDVTKSHRED